MAVTANWKVDRITLTYPPYNKATGGHNPNATPALTEIRFVANDLQIRNVVALILVLSGDQRPSYTEGQTSAITIANSA